MSPERFQIDGARGLELELLVTTVHHNGLLLWIGEYDEFLDGQFLSLAVVDGYVVAAWAFWPSDDTRISERPNQLKSVERVDNGQPTNISLVATMSMVELRVGEE